MVVDLIVFYIKIFPNLRGQCDHFKVGPLAISILGSPGPQETLSSLCTAQQVSLPVLKTRPPHQNLSTPARPGPQMETSLRHLHWVRICPAPCPSALHCSGCWLIPAGWRSLRDPDVTSVKCQGLGSSKVTTRRHPHAFLSTRLSEVIWAVLTHVASLQGYPGLCPRMGCREVSASPDGATQGPVRSHEL